jgi:hypothetical protein
MRYKNLKIVKCFEKVELLGCAVSLRLLKIEQSKYNRDYHITMINLGKSKEVTTVLKL